MGLALLVVYHRQAILHVYGLFRTGSDAEFAFEASHRAGFPHHCFDGIAVGAEGNRTFAVPGYEGEDLLGAGKDAFPAPCAFVVIHMGNPVFPYMDGIKGAGTFAITEPITAPGAELRTPGREFGGCAGFDSYVFALLGGPILGALTHEDRYLILRFDGNA